MLLQDGEPIEQALRRFRKLLDNHNVKREQRWYVHFVSASWIRRVKRFRKRIRSRLATLAAQQAGEQPVGSLAQAAATLRRRTGKP